MSQDFIPIKQLEGELVLSQVKGTQGASVTTKEILFQKPHHTYHILFEHILSIIPYQLAAKHSEYRIADELQVHSYQPDPLYKVSASELIIVNRSGKYIRKETEIVLPLSSIVIEKVDQYSGLTALTT